MANRKFKKGTILLLIASLGFLVASIWMIQTQLKPKNIGDIQFAVLDLGNGGQDKLFYIDKAVEYSLKNALEIKSRIYKSQEKTYTNKEVCNLQLDACKEKKPDCETNLKLFCNDEVEKGFKESFTKYLEILNAETNNKLEINDYQFEIKTITSEIMTKAREIEITGKTTKTLKSKEGDVGYSINPNFRVRAEL